MAKKAAKKKTAPTKRSAMKAVRYTAEEKAKILQFVVDHNKQNGRGGQSTASNKFNVSPVSIGKWAEAAGSTSGGKKRKASPKTKAVRATKAPPKARGTSAPKASAGEASAVLLRMIAIQNDVATLQSEYEALKKTL